MGEKLHYYCSSSEGEDEEDEEGRVDDDNFDVEKSKKAQADKIAEKAYLGVSGKFRFFGDVYVRREDKILMIHRCYCTASRARRPRTNDRIVINIEIMMNHGAGHVIEIHNLIF